MKAAILGGGLTGLELGRRLKDAKKDFILFEKEPNVGGICRTNKTGRYLWDFGVHAMYSRSKETMDYFKSLPLDCEHLDRNVKIFHSGSDGKKYILEYPFETAVKDLPLKDKMECIDGYLKARGRKKKRYANLEDWINSCLGHGMAKHFMTPYNKKIWNCELSKISYTLVGSKIEPASVIDFILSALGKKVVGRKYQAKYIYPKRGIQELADYTAKDINGNLSLNKDVERLTKQDKKWKIITSDGVEEEADIIISTIPLVELLKKVDLPGLKKEYDVFKWNDTFFIMVGLKEGFDFQLIKDCHWVFFKEDEIFYRITLMHNFSKDLPTVLVAEITKKGDILKRSKEEVKTQVVKDLIRKGIIKDINQIEEVDIKLLNHTYPIPTIGLEETKKHIQDVLKENNVFLLGRNGNWDYINMDGVIQNVEEFLSKNILYFS